MPLVSVGEGTVLCLQSAVLGAKACTMAAVENVLCTRTCAGLNMSIWAGVELKRQNDWGGLESSADHGQCLGLILCTGKPTVGSGGRSMAAGNALA